MLVKRCNDSRLGWVDRHLKLTKRLLNATPVLFDRFALARPYRCVYEDVDSAKWLGYLKSIPASFEDPSSCGNRDHIEHGGACLLRQRGDAFMNSIAWPARPVDRKVRWSSSAYVLNQFVQG
jgi:hypothetical protein